MRAADLRENTKNFIANPKNMPNMAETPKKAIISLKNDRGTSYEAYIKVYNELKAAYRELWDDAADAQYGRTYEELELAEKKALRAEIPLVISEAEPTSFGEE